MLSRHVVLVYSWVASRCILRGCIRYFVLIRGWVSDGGPDPSCLLWGPLVEDVDGVPMGAKGRLKSFPILMWVMGPNLWFVGVTVFVGLPCLCIVLLPIGV